MSAQPENDQMYYWPGALVIVGDIAVCYSYVLNNAHNNVFGHKVKLPVAWKPFPEFSVMFA